MGSEGLVEVLEEAIAAVRAALEGLSNWGPSGLKAGQYRSDLVADEAALKVLLGAGLSVLSEESGTSPVEGSELLAVVDPLDGSTNAARGIPWYATSICVLDGSGPLVAVVENLSSGRCYRAVRGEGAECGGRRLETSGCSEVAAALVGISGYPRRYLGWKQFRALGAVALDLCAVADGTLDGYVDFGRDAHGSWDYLGGALVCTEAGGLVRDVEGRELSVRTHEGRRAPVAGATAELCEKLAALRSGGERDEWDEWDERGVGHRPGAPPAGPG